MISRDSQKDRITYINLCSQIEDAKSKGYTSEEIAQAVKRAVSTGSELRTILDSKTEMPLETVLTFVRGYLQEKTAEELYKDLNDMCQADNEDPQSFVLRAMGIREKIIKASESDTGSLIYNKQLIQGMFLRTIKTGLRDVSIKAEVKDVLCAEASDSEILTALNKASLEEEQSKMKRINATRKTASVNKVQTTSDSEREGSSTSAACGRDDLAESVKLLTKEVTAMRKELDGFRNKVPVATNKQQSRSQQGNKNNSNNSNRKPWGYWKRGCKECTDAGKTNSCQHCWNCGGDDHKEFECPATLNN